MEPPEKGDVPGLLASWAGGDRGALDRLMPIVYDELRCLAHRELRREERRQLIVSGGRLRDAAVAENPALGAGRHLNAGARAERDVYFSDVSDESRRTVQVLPR
jgi:ECF sigma factor